MTQLDVTYNLLASPRERSVLALSSLREVYGIRKLDLDERSRTLRIEYDGTRFTEPGIRQLLRRAGMDLKEEHAPKEAVPDEAATT